MCKTVLFLFLFFGSLIYAREPIPDLLTAGGGLWHVDHGGFFYMEYRSWIARSHAKKTLFRPQVGFLKAPFQCYFAYGGIAFDFIIKKHFAFTPSFSPGIYFHNHHGRDLGFPIEFRTALELSFILKDKMRVGCCFFHISNASIGDKNPGVNCFGGFLSFPLSIF